MVNYNLDIKKFSVQRVGFMNFKITLQSGRVIEFYTKDFKSAAEFSGLIGRLESGKFVNIDKLSISKDHIETIEEIQKNG
jgi:hypothetical protein